MNVLETTDAIDREPTDDIKFEILEPDDPENAARRIEEIRQKTPSDPDLLKWRVKLGPNPSPQARYDMEYKRGIYQSYKPGIDDFGIEKFLGRSLWFPYVTEIGGGLANIANLAL